MSYHSRGGADQIGIQYVHWKIHDGEFFRVSQDYSIANSGVAEMLFVTRIFCDLSTFQVPE